MGQGVTEERKQILMRGADWRLDVVSKQSFQYLGHKLISKAGSIWIFTRQPGASMDSFGRVINERSVLKLVWFKLRWLGVSDGIHLQIDHRLQQWKSWLSTE